MRRTRIGISRVVGTACNRQGTTPAQLLKRPVKNKMKMSITANKSRHVRLTALLLGLCATMFLATACGKKHGADDGKTAQAADSAAWIMRVARTSRLYTAEYHVHKIVTHDDVLRVQGTFFSRQFSMKVPLGDRKIAIPIDATLKAYIDFGAFSQANVQTSGKMIRVTLPDPRVVVTSSKIDHAGTKQYVAFTRSDYSDAEMASFAQQGLASIVQSVPELGILDAARENAARTLVPILCSMGYSEENIVITFRKEFTAADLPSLVDMSQVKR